MVVVFFQQPLASVKRNRLLVFTVALSKIKIESVQLIKSTIWEMKTFSICEIFENVLLKFIKLCMESPCWSPSEGQQHGGRKPSETSVTKFCSGRTNSSLEGLMQIEVIFFLILGLFR